MTEIQFNRRNQREKGKKKLILWDIEETDSRELDSEKVKDEKLGSLEGEFALLGRSLEGRNIAKKTSGNDC